MSPEPLLFAEKAERIGTIVINRPDKRNAFTHAMWNRLGELIEELESDDAMKVIVLRSSDGRAFSAGADISEFRERRSNAGSADDYDEAVRSTEARLAACAKPTIAMVSGFCVGGGCELAVACDFRFVSKSSVFGITPANIGLVYSLAATRRLVDLVGQANAKLMLMTAQLVDAERAVEMGLVTVLCSDTELDASTYDFARLLASKAQLTVQGTKRIIAMILDGATADNDESTALQKTAYESADYREGVEAFLARRKPDFS
jgi:enoyl-CoA hydratase/carnithine racemase